MYFYLLDLNKYLKRFSLIPLLIFIASCGGGNDPATTTGARNGSITPDQSYTIKVNHNPDITFSDANIRVVIYGTHRFAADNTATVISNTVVPITTLPSNIELTWPDNAYTLIKNPEVLQSENAMYYFSITIDADNDGMMCNNTDYRQDYKKTTFFTISGKPSKITDFYVTPITRNWCEKF